MAGRCAPCFGCVASWLAVVRPPSGVWGFMAGRRAPAFRWVWSLEASDRIKQPGTQTGVQPDSSVRRGSRVNGSLSGFF